MNPWLVLGIASTNDSEAIRKAYNKLIRIHHPEDDPDGFMMIRTAYEQVLKMLDQTQEAGISMEIGISTDSLQEVLDLYNDFFRRIQISQWEQLFATMSLECYDTLVENAPLFFNEHYHLPSDIWRYLDGKFSLFSDSRFFRFDAYLSQLGFSFVIFSPEKLWDYEQYVELRYKGSVCYSQQDYKQALNYFRRAYEIYDEELALRIKIGQIYYINNCANDVSLLLGTITRTEIGNISDAHILNVMFQTIDDVLSDKPDLFCEPIIKNEIDMRQIVFLYLYDITALYMDFFSRMNVKYWENLIIHIPEKVKTDLSKIAPYFFNICYCIPFCVWELVEKMFSLENNMVFKKRWVLHSNIKLDYVIYHPDILWKCEDYVLNWYDGIEAYGIKDYENTAKHLDMAYETYAGDQNVFEALTEAHFALGNISCVKHCYDAYFEMDWNIEETFYPPATVDINLIERGIITVVNKSFEGKCREFLLQKKLFKLLLCNLGYWIFAVRFLPVKAFFLRGLCLQEKDKWLKFFAWILEPEWNDNFEIACFYAHMESMGVSAYFFNNPKNTSGYRTSMLAAFLVVTICAIIGVLFL